MRSITAVALDITTACNLSCPECCCAIPTRPSVYYPWSYFEHLAPFIVGIDRVDITGGEPTCHPRFGEFAARFRELFQCSKLTLETNGFKARKYADALSCFDSIRLSRYQENGQTVDWILANYPATVQNGSICVEIGMAPDERGHVALDRRGSGAPCHLGKCEFTIYSGGRFYGCRLGPAILSAASIEPCIGWDQKAAELPLPCGDCCFSV